MEAFATADDLERGWRSLADAERDVAEEQLLRASAELATLLRKRGIAVEADDELQALNLRTVTCNMVRRSMSGGAADGLASMSQTIGSTSASVSWSNPDGAFYLSKNDKALLGLDSARAGWAGEASGGA